MTNNITTDIVAIKERIRPRNTIDMCEEDRILVKCIKAYFDEYTAQILTLIEEKYNVSEK